MFRSETTVARPMLGDFPGTPEIGPRRGCQNEIPGALGPKELEQLARGVGHVSFHRSRQELSIVEFSIPAEAQRIATLGFVAD